MRCEEIAIAALLTVNQANWPPFQYFGPPADNESYHSRLYLMAILQRFRDL